MSENSKSALEAAQQLTPEQRRQLVEGILAYLTEADSEGDVEAEKIELRRRAQRQVVELVVEMAFGPPNQSQVTVEPGKARQHFGAWDSGDARSADNDRIDRDLAREYDGAR